MWGKQDKSCHRVVRTSWLLGGTWLQPCPCLQHRETGLCHPLPGEPLFLWRSLTVLAKVPFLSLRGCPGTQLRVSPPFLRRVGEGLSLAGVWPAGLQLCYRETPDPQASLLVLCVKSCPPTPSSWEENLSWCPKQQAQNWHPHVRGGGELLLPLLCVLRSMSRLKRQVLSPGKSTYFPAARRRKPQSGAEMDRGFPLLWKTTELPRSPGGNVLRACSDTCRATWGPQPLRSRLGFSATAQRCRTRLSQSRG